MKKKILSAVLIAALITSFSACGSGSSSRSAAETNGGEAAINGGESFGASPDATIPVTTAAAPSYDESYDAAEYEYSEDFYAADGTEDYSRRDSEKSQSRAGLLTGGEWRDNSNFVFWTKLFEQRADWADAIDSWKISTLDRVFVRVKDANGSPGAGMTVKLTSGNTILWESVTDSRGEAFLYQSLLPSEDIARADKIIVEAADGRAVTTPIADDYKATDTAIEIAVPDSSPMRTKLDLMMMIDTTGSMSDELSYLQTELENVINRVVDNTQADVQLSVNFYRDNGDDYVVRDFGFTDRIGIALDHLEDQRASGGGDYPEAVTKALDNGINAHDWRSDSEKLMILVLDAPPHHDDGVAQLKQLIRSASKLGIRIIPVASSGVDTDTEFLCRCMAMATGGTYTFLTDDRGIGNSHLEPTIGNYTVEKLNDMLVRIISDYFSQEPRQYAASQSSETPETRDYGKGKYAAAYIYSNAYYEGEGMYRSGVIRNREEADEFIARYDGLFNDILDNMDFTTTALAYNIDMLSSGSIKVNDSAGVYCTIENGEPVFHYELDIPEVGTADIKTLIVFAEIPSPALMVKPE